jgi:hypothetical protein
MDFLRRNQLWDFEDDPITVFPVLAVGLQNLIILSRLSVQLQQWPGAGEIYFQKGEMFEILLNAVNWEYFFDKGPPGEDLVPFGYSAFIAVYGVYLSDPAGISSAGGTEENRGMKKAKMKGFRFASELVNMNTVRFNILLG